MGSGSNVSGRLVFAFPGWGLNRVARRRPGRNRDTIGRGGEPRMIRAAMEE